MIVLASASPRRRELLKLIFNDFECCAPDVDEHIGAELSPSKQVEILAERKAREVAASRPHDVVIAADTLVFIDDEPLGKPIDDEDAANMLKKLSGREHFVCTGFCVAYNGHVETASETTSVVFDDLSDDEINAYIATGETGDKAGSYGIQGQAAKFIKRIEGCYFNVMGLPVHRLYSMLKSLNLIK